MNDFVLEIGVENIPASYIAPAVSQLESDAAALMESLRLDHGAVSAAGTPRRLTVVVEGLAERQRAAEEVVTGPPVDRAFDADGNPTAAAQGFARSRGVDVGALEKIPTDRGEYIGVRRRLPRRKTTALLRDELPGLVAGLRFPKSMKWEASGARFARPVRWIVALYGTTSVRFRFADVTSGARTWGRPWMKRESAAIRSASSYRDAIARLGIVLDHEKRRDRIRTLAERAAKRLGLVIVDDPGLIEELSYMVENPRVLVGSFPDRYLSLPAEVVTTAMRSHQRYIALSGTRGKLAPRFITFTDGPVSSPAEVRRGNERVLKARLEDALFYWREDLKRGVDGLADELDRIVFIEGLGTIGEKAARMARLAGAVNRRLQASDPVDPALVIRAARLAKADVASEMIKDGKEFTNLQGLIGAHYAREAGEDRVVVAGIREQYRPRTPAEPVPSSTLGGVLGVADRVDTICGCFLAGFKPTGSQDPYGLRRAANGLIRILDREPGVALDELIDEALEAYGESGAAGTSETRGAIVEFMKSRAQAYLRDNGVPYDVADAVVPVSWTRPGTALRRARAIARMRGNAVFERLITGVKRVGNILSEDHRALATPWERIRAAVFDGRELAKGVAYASDRFEDAAERELDEALRSAIPGMAVAEAEDRFSDVLTALSALADPIDGYFDTVLVNCEDPATRANRHGFLAVVYAVFGRVADFSRIVEQGAPDPAP